MWYRTGGAHWHRQPGASWTIKAHSLYHSSVNNHKQQNERGKLTPESGLPSPVPWEVLPAAMLWYESRRNFVDCSQYIRGYCHGGPLDFHRTDCSYPSSWSRKKPKKNQKAIPCQLWSILPENFGRAEHVTLQKRGYGWILRILCKISQLHKDKYCMNIHIWGISDSQTHWSKE